jgi:hypothetical protein
MVKNDLLVIQTHDRETRGRPTCQEVHAKLCNMLRNCEAKEDYACDPCPRLDDADEQNTPGDHSKEYRWIDTVNLPEAGSGPTSLEASDIKQF